MYRFMSLMLTKCNMFLFFSVLHSVFRQWQFTQCFESVHIGDAAFFLNGKWSISSYNGLVDDFSFLLINSYFLYMCFIYADSCCKSNIISSVFDDEGKNNTRACHFKHYEHDIMPWFLTWINISVITIC